MVEKNRISIGLRGREIDFHIIATSEEMAMKIYESIERAVIEIIRIDLESEWERDDEGGNRHV